MFRSILLAISAMALAAPAAGARPLVVAWAGPVQDPGALALAVPFHDDIGGRTVRDVVRPTLDGSAARLRLSNLYGSGPLTITDARIAKSAGGAATAGPSTPITFGGHASVTIPAGGTTASDVVGFRVRAGQNLAVSLYSAGPTGTVTGGGSLFHTTYISDPGDVTADGVAASFPTTSKDWYFLSGVDVRPVAKHAAAAVAIGASITTGYASTPDAGRGWVDLLARRLRKRHLALVDTGIAGNNLHEDTGCYGASILHRLDRDALDLPGVTTVVLANGGNDLTHPHQDPSDPCIAHTPITTAGLIADYKVAIRRIHAKGMRAIVATIPPFGANAHWSPDIEAQRTAVNAWIRSSPLPDAVIDEQGPLEDPADPTKLNPAYDSGDGLHPTDAGHAALARSIPLSVFSGTRTARATAAVKPLPKNFIWGVSSSGFQSEGHTTDNNWNYYIQRDDGPNPVDKPKDPYGNSVDFYDRYASDIKLAAGLGVNTYRISINWARVEPQRGVFSEAGLRYYDRVFAAMKRNGIRPLITLNHWDYPMWVYQQGGWTSGRTVSDFAAFTRVLAKRYANDATYWLTFNEEFFYEFIEQGNYPLSAAGVAAMRTNLIAAHQRAYKIIHRFNPHAMVSTNYAWPGRGALASVESDKFLAAVRHQMDYAAVDYYYPAYDQTATLLQLSAGTGWNIPVDPFGMYTALRSMHREFPKLPVLITENGLSTDNGQPRTDGVTREENLRDTLYWVQRARADGVPVIGYMYWSLTHNYEWGSYSARLGLYSVDVLSDPTLTRHPTAAVPVFKALVRSRGVAGSFTPTERPLAANCDTEAVAAEDRAACHAAAQ